MNELTREELDGLIPHKHGERLSVPKAVYYKLISAARKGLELLEFEQVEKQAAAQLQQQLADATKERHSETHYQNRLDETSQLQGQVEDLSKKLGKEHTELENATKLLAAARDRVKELEKDKKRLDYLQSEAWCHRDKYGWWRVGKSNIDWGDDRKDLRQAIDAAIAKEGK